MLVPARISTIPFVTAYMPDLMGLELSPELLLLTPLVNPCSTYAAGTLVGVVRLVPSGITSALFGMTGIPELGQLEQPSTIGTSGWLETPCLLE